METKEISCKFCGRYLFKQAGTVVVEGIICPNSQCKARLNFKLIQADDSKNYSRKFVEPEQPPKQKAVEPSAIPDKADPKLISYADGTKAKAVEVS